MEVPDVLVVNKSDQTDLATRATADLRAALASLRAADALPYEVPIVKTSARDHAGIDVFAAALRAHKDELVGKGQLSQRRRDGKIAWGVRAFVHRYGEKGVEERGGIDCVVLHIAVRVDAGAEIPEIEVEPHA